MEEKARPPLIFQSAPFPSIFSLIIAEPRPIVGVGRGSLFALTVNFQDRVHCCKCVANVPGVYRSCRGAKY